MEKKNLTGQPGSEKESMAGIDFFCAILLMGFSLGIALWSLKMPRFSGWSTAPGLLPLFLCICTFFMSLSLLISSIRKRGHREFMIRYRALSLSRWIGDTKTIRSLRIIVLTAIYVFVLLNRVPFEVAGFIYLTATLSIFWRKGSWLKIILISLLLPLAIGGLFRGLFLVFLPGESFFDWLPRILK